MTAKKKPDFHLILSSAYTINYKGGLMGLNIAHKEF